MPWGGGGVAEYTEASGCESRPFSACVVIPFGQAERTKLAHELKGQKGKKWGKHMNTKEETLVKWVQTFYQENQEYLEFVRSVACGRSNTISLRILDWLVTSYAKRHSVVIFHNGQAVHLHSNYKNFLASHSKRLFDAFRRRQRVSVDETGAVSTGLIDEDPEPYFVTTIAQLVFFQWAHSIGVIAYAENHVRDIEDDLRSYRA